MDEPNKVKVAKYKNSWHKPGHAEYGPAYFETSVRPSEYRGFKIYERIEGKVWDQVIEGVCVGQNAGPRGARQHIDEMLERLGAGQPLPYSS